MKNSNSNMIETQNKKQKVSNFTFRYICKMIKIYCIHLEFKTLCGLPSV